MQDDTVGAAHSPYVRRGEGANGGQDLRRPARDARPSGAVVMEDRPVVAHSPDVRRGRAPDAGESPRRPAPYGPPGRAVVMEDYRVEEFSVVVLDPDSPHVRRRGAPDGGEINGQGCRTRHPRPYGAVVVHDCPAAIAALAAIPDNRCR